MNRAFQFTGNAPRQANALRYQTMAFHEMTVIEALADEQFLSRYGFPIGLLRLCVLAVTEPDKPDAKPYVREEDQYRLERPGLLAMREYVPGASFFVGNKVVTSHGLLKHWTGANLNTAIGFRGQMAECVNGHRFRIRRARLRGLSPLRPQPSGQLQFLFGLRLVSEQAISLRLGLVQRLRGTHRDVRNRWHGGSSASRFPSRASSTPAGCPPRPEQPTAIDFSKVGWSWLKFGRLWQ